MGAQLPFPNPVTNMATYIARRTATSQIKFKKRGVGLGEVGGIIYVNQGAPVALFDSGQTAGTLSVVTGLTVVEQCFGGFLHRSTFTLVNVPITLLDSQNGVGTQIYAFPKGLFTILGAAGQVIETTTSVLASTLNTGITYNWGVGTTTQANGTLATTEQDLLPTTNGTASATVNVAAAASKGQRASAPALFDGHGTAKTAFFNVGVATATDIDGDSTTLWSGAIVLDWILNTASV